MYRALVLGCFLLWTGAAASEEADRCDSVAEFARSIMELRQLGYSIREVKNLMLEEPEPGLSRPLLIEAFETPIDRDYRARVVNEFESKAHLNCLKAASTQ